MNLFEFLYFGFYLGMLTAMIVAIQTFESRYQKSISVEVVEEPFLEKEQEQELEEPGSEEEKEAPAEEYTMTENPMFRHRNVTPLVEQVD
jgi:hypothetical protein